MIETSTTHGSLLEIECYYTMKRLGEVGQENYLSHT